MKNSLPLLVVAGLLLSALHLHAQTPTIQDCLGAIPICEPIYYEDQVANGMGNYPDEINNAISCLADERNAIWYTFTVNETGNFGFILTANDPNDDYDWALYDITNAECADIRYDPSLLVSCNAAGQQGADRTCIGPTGPTGDSDYNIQGAGCHTNPPTMRNGLTPLNALVPVEKYNTYVLVVSNWSRSTNGYKIDFGVSGGIGIFDLEDPEVVNATFPEQCGDNRIEIEFNENIQCATVNNFNFVLEGPGAPYDVQVQSPICSNGGAYTRTFELLVDPPITQSGDFTLSLDGDRSTEVLDLCNNPAFNTSLEFSLEIDNELTIDLGDDIDICPGNGVKLDATIDASISTNEATYLWSTGATTPTITASEAGTYGVTVTLGCASGSDEVNLIVDGENSGPYVNLGGDRTLCTGERIELDATNFDASYSWSTGSTNPIISVSEAGTYEVTVTDECGTTIQSVTIDYRDAPEVDLGEDRQICSGESFVLNVETEGATYLWQNGSTEPTFEVVQAGNYAVSVTTSCGTVSDELSLDYLPALSLNLGEDQSLCDENSVVLDAQSTDETATYLWQDGSTNPTFISIESGTYAVTVTNSCESVSDEVNITFGEGISFNLGDDQQLCEGETVTLNPQVTATNLLWQDGSSNATFDVTEAGVYWVEVTSDCGVSRDSVVVEFLTLPAVNLGGDQRLCEGEALILEVISDFAIEWQDGSTADSILVSEAGTYSATVSNKCGTASDEMTVSITPDFELNLGEDLSICEGEELLLAISLENVNLRWQNGSQTPTLSIAEAGLYWLEASNDCFSKRDSIEVEQIDLPNIQLGEDGIICEGETIELSVMENENNHNFEWQDGSTTNTFMVTEAGVYEVTASNDCGISSDQIRFAAPTPIEVDLGQDTTICEGESYLLRAGDTNDLEYRWQDGSDRPNFIAREAGYYRVQVSNECETQLDEVFLQACQVCDLYAPNAFSPNVDGQNDRFLVFPSCTFIEYELQIFDRWGTIIFTSNNLESGWDGMIQHQTAPPGIYVWQVHYMVEENYEMRKGIAVGEVNLFR